MGSVAAGGSQVARALIEPGDAENLITTTFEVGHMGST